MTPNESVEKARFRLFSNPEVIDFIDCKFTKNDFSYRLNAKGQARCKASPAPSCWPSALNPSWKATVPCGVCPSKDRAKKTSCGTPLCTSPDIFLNPNFM